MNLKDKTAVITGSTGSLGSSLSLALARAGCHCICHYHKNHEKARQLIADIKKYSVTAISIQADLTDPGQIESLLETADSLGTAQILINSAALFETTPLDKVTLEDARKFFDLNVTAALLAAKSFAARLKDTAGKIINISDIAAIHPWSEYSLYCSSKAALIGLTKSLAKELAPNILVNAIAPGIATWPTEMTPEQKKRQLSFIPMSRFAETEEIAAAMIFLLRNDYITGQTLAIAGGRAI
ncbi:MAG: SDR family oxidoreductase [Phycisphaerales bacterium]|jgi:NAD(P)-dependent dehydrogenase (short-subunit alcohol dehydrogenase family)